MALIHFSNITWQKPLRQKIVKLAEWLETTGGVIIGYSGGVDSTFLSAMAFQILGKKTLAVTINTPFLAGSELREARSLARLIGVRHRVVKMDIFDDPQLIANPPDRCYHCKKLDFSALFALADKINIKHVCDGGNADDTKDYRPGNRATSELGVDSPLREFGFSKSDIRMASRKLGLPTADKPAAACLASRLPYGTPFTPEALRTVEKSEDALKTLGFRQCRLRLHGEVGRIEIPPKDFKRIVAQSGKIVAALRKAGVRYVTLDLQGYRMGSLNESLKL